jgi:hypothetical protein
VLHRICSDHRLVLSVASQLEPLPLQVIQISTLHAHRYEDLVLVIETSPSSPSERQTRHVKAIPLSYLVERDLLDHLETEDRLATLTLRPHLLSDNITNHFFEAHVMFGVINPLLGNDLYMIVCDLEGNLPVVYGKVRY